MKTSQKEILEKIRQSPTYKSYEDAFQIGMQMPLTLRPVETWGLPLNGCRNENPFCALMADDRKTCGACLEAQQQFSPGDGEQSKTMTCFAGLSETIVPVHHNGSPIGYLQTGQVRTEPATSKGFNAVHKQLTQWGATLPREDVEKAYHSSSAVEPQRYDSMIKLLEHFAEHLEMVANQIVVQGETSESPLIQRARKFIEENFSEEVSLGQVAKAMNMSIFYFCKVFKKSTGLTFTEYLTRIRIEKAKEMLLNPHTRISEAAFAVGFQSLSQFNRAFKNITGQPPTEYRRKLPSAMVA
ncbi:MAG: helix-turn-helix domain-containing protein [Opitutales bacterium]